VLDCYKLMTGIYTAPLPRGGLMTWERFSG